MTEILPKHVVRTGALRSEEAVHVRHPLNPNSDVRFHPLSRRAGMKRAHLNLARVPPGKESFIPHAHGLQEEFIYVLEGAATVVVGETRVAVGPGDFIGFPIDGVTHHLINTGARDLVYLMGGEDTPLEVTRFPSAGKLAIFDSATATVRFYDEATAQTMSEADWIKIDG